MAWRSITFRLTAWYCLVLFLGFAVFSFAMWVTVRSALQAGVDDLLVNRMNRLVQTVSTEADGPDDVADNLIDLLRASPEGHFAQAQDGQGRQVFPLEGKEPPPILWARSEPAVGASTLLIEQRPYRSLDREVSLLGRSYRILLASSLEGEALVRARLERTFLVIAPLALILCSMCGWYIARRGLRPVEAIADAAAQITSSRLSKRIAVPNTGDALERLSRTFNEMLERLEASFARVEQFSADASHELKTPLSVIRTTAELSLNQGGSEERRRKDLQDIHAEAQRLGGLIEVLLTLACQDAGAQAIEMAEVDLVALNTAVCRQFHDAVEAKGLSLREVRPESAQIVIGNAPSLQQLMSCLLDNALAHTLTGGITVSIHSTQGSVEVNVTDTGEGIPAEALNKIFDRFYRVDPSRGRASGHLGLGLSIAQRIAELHGARLSVESREGEGSSFTVRFPAARES